MDVSTSALPLATTTWDAREHEALQDVLASGRLTMGPRVAEFEAAFAAAVGSRHAVMVNSGSSANLLAVATAVLDPAVDLAAGDEVLVTAVSWATTYYPLVQHGLVPVLVDIDPHTLNVDVAAARAACSPRTKALLAVNLLGNPNDFDALSALCRQEGLLLLEDNCESLGATFDGRAAGSFGRMGTFSTYFSHHISTMEGGVVVTDDDRSFQMLHALRSHGWTRGLPETSELRGGAVDEFHDLFRFVLPGYNVRPLELSGAVGVEQVKKLDTIVAGRRRNAAVFVDLFAGLEGVRIQREVGTSSWFGFALVLEDRFRGRRDDVVRSLADVGVETRPLVAGNFARQPVADRLGTRIPAPLTVADEIHDHGFYVGNHHVDVAPALVRLREAFDTL